MLTISASIFVFGALLNFIWEFLHCRLYTTCIGMPKQKLSNLLTIMSLKDGFFIVLFYGVTVVLFRNVEIMQNIWQLTVFVLLCLTFSFIDERISIAKGRWQYVPSMPTVAGVGITPLLEIAATGVGAFWITFFLF